ncbi:MAG: hypothetical protein WA634_04855 [Silvibacterium sp.]
MTHDNDHGVGAKRPSASLRAGSYPEADGWSLKLTALSADEPDRLVRFLTGALLACGGWVLTRTTQGNQAAELDFEFARASCVEIYAVLIAAGLELSRDSHLQMTDLCHCTKNLIESRAFDIARVDLVVYNQNSKQSRDQYALAPTG